ncbi:uncharacterized protein LOC143912373 [Arctopsyche grandis]|uniref:uncharacterized protein LOC143912373 n=1 Tax=Arctopsyche grandis TaxID=121162 RepID=UPI00406D7C47
MPYKIQRLFLFLSKTSSDVKQTAFLCYKLLAELTSRLRVLLTEAAVPRNFSAVCKDKVLLERDVCEAQERATGLQTLWQNCKNDLVAARLDAASAQRQLTSERTKLRQTKDQVGDLMSKMKVNEQQIKTLQRDLKLADAKILSMKDVLKSKDEYTAVINRDFQHIKEKMSDKTMESEKKSKDLEDKIAEIADLNNQMKLLRTQLDVANEKLTRWPFYIFDWCNSFGNQIQIFNKLRKWTDFPITAMKRVINTVTGTP